MKWFGRPCESCAAKDERIAALVNEVARLVDVHATMLKLEELAKLEKRQHELLDSIQMLQGKRRAEEKASREVPPNWMSGRTEGEYPRL